MKNPNTSNSDLADTVKIAQFRFALIAPVIQGLFQDASRAEYYRRVTEKPLTLPDGSQVVYKPKTLEKWVSLYNRGGFDALMPKERSLSVSDQAAKHLKAYINAYHKEDMDPCKPLFYTVIHGKTNHMPVRNIERIVKKYGDIVRPDHPNIPCSTHPHLLRRTRTGLRA